MIQTGSPVFLDASGRYLEQLHRIYIGNGRFTEDWIQKTIHENPSILPVDQLEPSFCNLIALCRELPLESGYLDNLYINEKGLLTIVECKLWKNPESRRKVIGQILDYAKDISEFDYEILNNKIKSITSKCIYEIVKSEVSDLVEYEFVDNVNRHLKNGNYLLLIVGDGIHEGMAKISDYLDRYANLRFSFSLVELRVYEKSDKSLLIMPSPLVKTYTINRTVNFQTTHAIQESGNTANEVKDKIKTTISEELYFNKLEISVGKKTVDEFIILLDHFKNDENFIIEFENNSFKIKDAECGFNYSTFHVNGDVKQYGCVTKAEELGLGDIGNVYLDDLAKVVPGSKVNRNIIKWQWRITVDDKPLRLIHFMERKDEFIELVKRTQINIAGKL